VQRIIKAYDEYGGAQPGSSGRSRSSRQNHPRA
jgi:hypothetical protein